MDVVQVSFDYEKNSQWIPIAVSKCVNCEPDEFDGVLPFDQTKVYTVTGDLTEFFANY